MVGTLDAEKKTDLVNFDEGWVRSACIICLNRCGILAHRTADGYVDKIVGDPDNPHNQGKTCAKGNSGMEGISPEIRVTTPMRRTHPDKGIGVDPKFTLTSDGLDQLPNRG